MHAIPIDVVILSRDEGPLAIEVEQALRDQLKVQVRVIRVVGRPRSDERHRWQTIARARNEGKAQATTPWVLFLDDDVVLGRDTIFQLWQALGRRTNLAAIAANYQTSGTSPWGHRHIAMGATLFRSSPLRLIRFRFDPRQCECQCCCDDLRKHGWGIDYLPQATAVHLKRPQDSDDSATAPPPRVLTAFDRRDVFRFEKQFLATLRKSGNHCAVSAVTYGLYPSEIARLSAMPGVEVHPHRVDGRMAPIRRLEDFAGLTSTFAPQTPIAYWDCADVFFQGSLDPLWEEARRRPDLILAAREPKSYPDNPAIEEWTRTIHDYQARRKAFQLLSQNPFLNSGFVAGLAGPMHSYFQSASRSMSGPDLAGTLDWGDQTALNFYCHSHPHRWHEVEVGWNYCVHDRYGEIALEMDGRVKSRKGEPVYVVHGNARSFRHLALSYLGSV